MGSYCKSLGVTQCTVSVYLGCGVSKQKKLIDIGFGLSRFGFHLMGGFQSGSGWIDKASINF